MVSRRDHVEKSKECFTASIQPDRLHCLGVAADLFDMNAVGGS